MIFGGNFIRNNQFCFRKGSNMKLIVHVPLSADREYFDDFDENTFPNVGDDFEEIYIVKKKEIKDGICELTLDRNREWYNRYEKIIYKKGTTMIYISYFAKLKELERYNIIPISISAKAPEWYKGLQYKKLAPKYEFFMEWKKNQDNEYYIEHFQKEILDKLDAANVIQELLYMIPNWYDIKDFALVCYEKPSDFCHRHLVAKWLSKNGFNCEEWRRK